MAGAFGVPGLMVLSTASPRSPDRRDIAIGMPGVWDPRHPRGERRRAKGAL